MIRNTRDNHQIVRIMIYRNNYSLALREHRGSLFLLDLAFLPRLKVKLIRNCICTRIRMYVYTMLRNRKHRMTADEGASASLPAANISLNPAASFM